MEIKCFVCPLCKTPTKDMQLSDEVWELTEFQKKWAARNEPIFLQIGREVLICPCGEKLIWFQMDVWFQMETEEVPDGHQL